MDFIYLITIQYNIIMKVLRLLFFFIDSLVYSLIPLMYDLIKKIVDVKLIADETVVIGQVANSIYSLLAIYMFFRLAFSLLNMLVNPDAIGDKEKGAGKIMTNIVICLILIVGMPTIFTMAETLQSNIINNDVIENIFLGQDVACDSGGSGTTHGGTGSGSTNTNTNGGSTTFQSQQCKALDFGDYIATTVLNMFVRIPYEEVRPKMNEANPKMLEAYDAVFNENTGSFHSLWIFNKYINYDTTFDSDTGGIAADEHVFWFAYLPIVSTIVGGFLVWTFINLAIEIAQRAVKLFVLRVISPIAIVSYIDPSSASKGVFKKWTDEYIKTYISLFIRLAVLALITLIVSKIDITQLSAGDNIFVFLFIILGLVSFIKTAPKMFENLFGFKSSGDSWGSAIVKKGLGFGAAVTGGLVGAGLGSVVGGISTKAQGLGYRAGAGVGAMSGLKSGFKATKGAKGLSGYGKAALAGWSGRKAVHDKFGYKGIEGNLADRFKYNQEKGLADNVVGDFKSGFNDSNTAVGAREFSNKELSTMNSKYGMVDFKNEDVVALRKAYSKGEGYKRMYGDGDYAKNSKEYAIASAKKQIFDRNLRRMQQNYTTAKSNEERRYYKDKYDRLVSAEGKINKDYDDAKKALDALDKNPKYAKEHQRREMFDRADALGDVKLELPELNKNDEKATPEMKANYWENDTAAFNSPDFFDDSANHDPEDIS